MKGASFCLVILSFVLQATPPARPTRVEAEAQPFVLGVLRRDGIVHPFAAFDGKRWAAPWPEDLRYVELPISLDGVPRGWWGKAGVPEEMAVWIGGKKQGTLRLAGLSTVWVMCAPRLALRSTYRSPEPAPPPIEQPYPKDGLVISGDQTIESIETIPRTSSEWIPAALTLLEPFDAAELAAVSRFTNWKHPVPRRERQRVPVELEAMYRAPMDAPGWTAYRVEAVKRYPPGPDDGGCGPMTSASGWIATGPEGKRWTRLAARITYCDRLDDVFTLPLGLITTGGRTYWIYQASGHGREGYIVARPTPALVEPIIGYSAGFCS
jgi:hypothetical protein